MTDEKKKAMKNSTKGMIAMAIFGVMVLVASAAIYRKNQTGDNDNNTVQTAEVRSESEKGILFEKSYSFSVGNPKLSSQKSETIRMILENRALDCADEAKVTIDYVSAHVYRASIELCYEGEERVPANIEEIFAKLVARGEVLCFRNDSKEAIPVFANRDIEGCERSCVPQDDEHGVAFSLTPAAKDRMEEYSGDSLYITVDGEKAAEGIVDEDGLTYDHFVFAAYSHTDEELLALYGKQQTLEYDLTEE